MVKMRTNGRKKWTYIGLAAAFGIISVLSFIEALIYSPLDKSYAVKFDGLLTSDPSYNATTATLMHYNNLVLGWTLLGLASLAMVILFVALASFRRPVNN